MRIWLLTSELPHEFAGGIAQYIENVARLFAAEGHEVVVIARTDTPYNRSVGSGVSVIQVTPGYARLGDAPRDCPVDDTHPAYPFNILAYWPALSYQMAEEMWALLKRLPPPDIIESQEYAALPYYLLQRRLTERTPLREAPVVVHLHSPSFELARHNQEPRYRFPEYWIGQMEKFCVTAADALLAPSMFMAQCIQQRLQRALDITCIPLPFLASASPALNSEEGDERTREILYVGRLELRKGVLPLVKACAQLWADSLDFRLTLVGGDTDFVPKSTTVGSFIRQRYARWIDSGHLRLAGRLDRTTVLAKMRGASAVVIPSVWENFPNTCMEAMGVGQVVLASVAGGQAEMIRKDGENGFLFDWTVSGDFERQLRVVLGLTKQERKQIGQQAHQRIYDLCNPESIIRRRIQHFQMVRDRHSHRKVFPALSIVSSNQTGDAEAVASEAAMHSEPEISNLLSVVIPFYNLGDYLAETIAGVLASNYAPLEIVIVNDGTTEEKGLAYLKTIEAQGLPNVRIVHTINQGLAMARNTGAEAAKGEFLAFVDADDLVEPTFFSEAIDVLCGYSNVTFVYSWVRYFGLETGIWPTWNAEFPYLLGHNMLTPLVVVRRSRFLRAGRNKPQFEYNFEDYESWMSLIEEGALGVSLPRPLVRYRVRRDSMYQTSTRNQHLYLYDMMAQLHPEAYREWGVELFNLQNANGPSQLWNHPALCPMGPAAAYMVRLDQLKSQVRSEIDVLAKTWEDHIQRVRGQCDALAELERQSGHAMGVPNVQDGAGLIVGGGTSRRDYELGGHLVRQLRRTWVAKVLFKHPRLKETAKRWLGM